MGSGTVMLNGFTFSKEVCLIYLFDGWVLDNNGKYMGACAGTFFFAVLTQVLFMARRLISEANKRRQVCVGVFNW